MDFLIFPRDGLIMREWLYCTLRRGEMYWVVHPLRPRDFPRPMIFHSGFTLLKSRNRRKASLYLYSILLSSNSPGGLTVTGEQRSHSSFPLLRRKLAIVSEFASFRSRKPFFLSHSSSSCRLLCWRNGAEMEDPASDSAFDTKTLKSCEMGCLTLKICSSLL